VNLFKLLGAALALRPERRVILSEAGNFPTDLYIAHGLAALLAQGHELRTVPGAEIEAAIDDRVAVVMLTHVNYHTGAMHDMPAVTRKAHAAGALMLWDLAHSAGAVPVDLAGCDVDLAVGCGYKFLNGGPGAPAFLYVAPRLQAQATYPLTGWLGHAAPFAFEPGYRPAGGVARATVGTPPVISLAALEVGVDIALSVPMAEVRAKSIRQTTLFAELVAQKCAGHGLLLASPADATQRGSQVCLAHPHAYPIMQALIAEGVIGDFRAPDILRFGITPLYLGYADLWHAVQVLRRIMAEESWQAPQFQVRRAVT
jgi:kynureninase